MHARYHYSTIYNSQDTEVTEVSIDWAMDKEAVVHIYSGLLLSYEKWNNAIFNNMDRPTDSNIEWSKLDQWRQISYDYHHMWNLIFKKDTNEFIYKTEADL